MYQKDGLIGGHVILLNPVSSEYYRETKAQAILALGAYPKGLQVAVESMPKMQKSFWRRGKHVIVTSYVFATEDKLGKYGKT
mgnify:CR=1 FL=1